MFSLSHFFEMLHLKINFDPSLCKDIRTRKNLPANMQMKD